ncbi:DUF6663 family protein [Natronorarus salvus]|uniref:DUF6663 family protein n=1 Tax=Natronorarus salvus TaxID=3117733 RepID=UPI002F2624DC
MRPTSEGRFRVLEDPHGEGLILVDVETIEATTVEPTERTGGVRPGYLIDGTVTWDDGRAELIEASVRERSLIEFVDGAEPLFALARELCVETRRAGEAVGSRTTYSTDGVANGALYAFADGGAREVFDEFATGTLPIEPLFERLGEHADPPHEAFVIRSPEVEFVLVYLVARRGSTLAETVRETYGRPRPTEPESGDGP